jgi:hypothetical protein
LLVVGFQLASITMQTTPTHKTQGDQDHVAEMPGSTPAAVLVTDQRGKEWRAEEERRLEAVQRIIISALVGVVLGSFSSVLAVYLAVRGARDLPRDSVLLLWFMTGVIGLITAAAILLVQRRRPYSPWVALGLLPLLISAHWIFK